jgi:hypothetical protein
VVNEREEDELDSQRAKVGAFFLLSYAAAHDERVSSKSNNSELRRAPRREEEDETRFSSDVEDERQRKSSAKPLGASGDCTLSTSSSSKYLLRLLPLLSRYPRFLRPFLLLLLPLLPILDLLQERDQQRYAHRTEEGRVDGVLVLVGKVEEGEHRRVEVSLRGERLGMGGMGKSLRRGEGRERDGLVDGKKYRWGKRVNAGNR